MKIPFEPSDIQMRCTLRRGTPDASRALLYSNLLRTLEGRGYFAVTCFVIVDPEYETSWMVQPQDRTEPNGPDRTLKALVLSGVFQGIPSEIERRKRTNSTAAPPHSTGAHSAAGTLYSNDSMSCGVGGGDGGGGSGSGSGGDERKSLEINCEKSIVGASSAIFHATAGIQLKSNRLGNGKRVGALPTQNAAALRRGEIPNLNI
ncbi:hypothetical protein HZH68_015669 [Vespula germanica]|uniref:Uncharacterized protein n=1 Tax=Vespula germanica TaxID=30212 RepID=A0A834JA18_VESGE|nr:hypothetical protein HZH68_015669 [Vespula germanica]